MSFGLEISFGRLCREKEPLPRQEIIKDKFGNIEYVITEQGKSVDEIDIGDSVFIVEDGQLAYGYNKQALEKIHVNS